MDDNWTRQAPEELRQTLDRLSSVPGSLTFPPECTQVEVRKLPFYVDFQLYRFTNFGTMPVFTYLYLSNGSEFIALDGSCAPIYAANRREPMRLVDTTVISYVDFYLRHVRGEEGNAFLVEDPCTMLESLSSEQREAVVRSFQPVRVTRDQADNVFRVSATVHYGRSLLEGTIGVAAEGRLTLEKQAALLVGIDPPTLPAHVSSAGRAGSPLPTLDDLFKVAEQPPLEGTTMIAKALEILAHSPHGQKLTDFALNQKVVISMLAAPEPVTYLPETRIGYIGFHPNNWPSPAAVVIMLTAILREAQQEFSGIKHPPIWAPREEHLQTSMRKHEDIAWYMCTVAVELGGLEAFARFHFLDEFRKMGHHETLDLYLAQEGP